MKYQRIVGVLALLAVIALPIVVVNAQSSATTRAQEILNRNADREADIAGRDAERLQEINAIFQNSYTTRIIPQVDAASADMRAVIIPINTTLANISDRLNNVINVLNDVGVQTKIQAADITVSSIVAFDVQEKFDNFLNCYDGSGGGACVVYDVPANGIADTIDGLQPEAVQPPSALLPFLERLDVISPAGGDLTLAGAGYASGGSGATLPFTTAFELDYTNLRENAVAEVPAAFAPKFGITPNMITTIQNWDNEVFCDVPGGAITCEFTDAQVFNIAVQVQLAKLRNDIEYLEGSLINVRQAVRAFVHDVLESLEYYQRIQAPYDPTSGQDRFDPQSRQGAN